MDVAPRLLGENGGRFRAGEHHPRPTDYLNQQEIRDFHHLYLMLAQMGSAENPAGAEEMEAWWGRNLRIYANIARISEPGDRVLVIYGSGHKFLLDQFVDRPARDAA